MTKPIDWTKPLRVVGTHEPIECAIMQGGAIYVGYGKHCRVVVDEHGRCGNFAVENIPPEPRIVERWTEVIPGPHGAYRTVAFEATQSTFTPSPGRRLAKLLIWETGE